MLKKHLKYLDKQKNVKIFVNISLIKLDVNDATEIPDDEEFNNLTIFIFKP